MLDFLISFLALVGVSLLLCLASHVLIWRWFEDELRDVFDWLLLLFVFVSAEVLGLLALIGFFGWFHFPAMIVASIGFFILAMLPIGGSRSRLGISEASERLRQLLFRQPKLGGKAFLKVILLLFGAWVSVEVMSALTQYPWEYDTWAYHLPIMIEWMQSQSLWEVFYAVWGGPLGYYPTHHELMTMWVVLPFGNDFFASVPNFWLMGVLLVVVYKFLKAMKVNDLLAGLGGVVVMLMPMFLRQLGTGRVDLFLVVGLLLSFYFLLRSFQRRDGLLLFPVLFSLAMVLGSKYLAIVYIAPVLVVFLMMAKYWRKASRYWFWWFLLVMGTLGSMWYWRNLILTGNPVFPAGVSVGDQLVFAGYAGLTERVQQLSLWARVNTSGQFVEWMRVMLLETGWHLYLIVGAYVAVLVEVISKLFFSSMKRGEGRVFVLILFSLPVYWFLYFISPYTADLMQANARYGMPWLLMGVIVLMYVIFQAGSFRKVLLVALLALMGWQWLEISPSFRMGTQPFLDLDAVFLHPSLYVGLLLLGLACCWTALAWRRQKSYWPGLLVVLALVSAVFFSELREVRELEKYAAWDEKHAFTLVAGYEWLDKNAAEDAVVANSFNPIYYPLYGPELRRKVGYVNINDCQGCDYADYRDRGMMVRDDENIEHWLDNLRAFGAEYLLMGYADQRGLEHLPAYEFDWVKERGDIFKEVFREEGVVVYRIVFDA